MDFSAQKHNRSITTKIIVTCLLACAAVILSLYISKVTFNGILSTVERLSKPNEKIQLVNKLFRNVVQLDQLQRDQANEAQSLRYNPFLNESHELQLILDTLHDMSLQNEDQVARIDSMKKILYRRDLLFLKYIKLHAGAAKNDTLAGQVKHLTGMIEQARLRMDNNFVTTSRTTTTIIDTLPDDGDKKNLWNRIFVKKKQPKQVQKKINEELKVRVDTLALGKSGDSLARLGAAITQVETSRTAQRDLLAKRQAELNRTGETLIAQLITILNNIEATETAHATQQNNVANELVNRSVVTISIVLGAFIAAISVLAFFIFTDISRSNQYRKELIAAKDEAEEAGLVKQRFLANMSHELRTPLQIIIGISEQIKDSEWPKQRDLQNIHQSSLYLLQIVNEVLDYSRIISGKFVQDVKPFNMHDAVNDVYEMIQVQAMVNGLTFNYTADIASDHYYMGDAFRLKQILLNLLGNAIKFTEDGGISLLVTDMEEDEGATSFTFIISDTGVGIPKESLATIFNQFEQGTNVQQQQGTGLGLSIVKALTDIQQGSLEVESTEGKGTTFTVKLKFEQTTATEDATTKQVAAPQNSGHVWVIDDDKFILQLCDTILNKHNISHTCFSSANEALATPFPEDISVVFLDIRMPEIDGITLCNKLRQRPPASAPQYIALTAQALPDEREAILQKGFDGLVMKPFLEENFMNAVYQYSSEQQHATLPAIDLSTVYKMAGGDAALINSSLDSFISETQKDLAAALDSMQNKDGDALAEALHKLAGRCGQLGIQPLAQQMRDMELALRKSPQTDTINWEISVIFQDLEAAISMVQRLRSDGKATA